MCTVSLQGKFCHNSSQGWPGAPDPLPSAFKGRGYRLVVPHMCEHAHYTDMNSLLDIFSLFNCHKTNLLNFRFFSRYII